jgi:hypothetical protein
MIHANAERENNKVIITKVADTIETFSICKNLIYIHSYTLLIYYIEKVDQTAHD